MEVNEEELRKQMIGAVLESKRYGDVRFLVSEDKNIEPFAEIKLKDISSQTVGKMIISVQEILKVLISKADKDTLYYVLTHSCKSETFDVYRDDEDDEK